MPPKKSSSPVEGIQDKPIYRGTFQQWYKVARIERDARLRFNALYACMSAGKSNAERQKVLDLIRPLVRKDGIQFISKGYDFRIDPTARDRCEKKLWEFCVSCDGDLTFKFIKTEIAEGTGKSCEFCSAWLKQLGRNYNDEADKQRRHETLRKVANSASELMEDLVKRLEEPAIIPLTETMIAYSDHFSPGTDLLRHSSLQEKIKQLVLNGTPELRVRLSGLAFSALPYDEEVFQAYQSDLMNPKLDTQLRYSSLRALLFQIETVNFKHKIFDKEKEPTRVASLAELVQKFVDGFLAEENPLVVTRRSDRHDRARNSDGTRNYFKPLKSLDLGIQMRHPFAALAKYLDENDLDAENENKIRQATLDALNKLTASIKNQTDIKDREARKLVLSELQDVLTKLNEKTK